MKKKFRIYLIIWAILLVLFNVIAFVSAAWIEQGEYTVSFWIGYVGITLMFAGQLACAWKVFREENLRRVFYNISLLRISYHGLIWSFVIGGACMLISSLPYWVGLILCAALLAFTDIAVVKAGTAAGLVNEVDERVRAGTFFIKSLTTDAESLLARAGNDELRASCKKVYEAARYSDPMSHSALASVESEIELRFAALSNAVKAGDTSATASLADELVILLRERNNKCRFFK